MNPTAAVTAFAALALFRLLVAAAPEARVAGEIRRRLDIPAHTLSFHLKSLLHAELLLARQAGRFVF